MNTPAETAPRTLKRRLIPLQVGVAVQTFMLWAAIEKLFMTQIGFTPTSIGIMAAAYAAVVPLLEFPSGIIADRWSRSALMVAAGVALAASETIGALSHGVLTYTASAMVLGVYFAVSSGTVDSIVYDTVIEETGSSSLYERSIGLMRVIEAVALSGSAVLGGLIAAWTSPRSTYWISIPFALMSIVAFVAFNEPTLHRQAEPVSLRQHTATTIRVMVTQPAVRHVIVLAAAAAMLQQAVFEFGPLWLVANRSPAATYGPYWAVLVGSLGVGGYLVTRAHLDRHRNLAVFAALLAILPVPLALTHALIPTIVTQTLLVVLLSMLGIRAGLLVHDTVASNVRAGVSSGVGTLSWVLFLPFSLLLGWVSRAHGVGWAGWCISAVAVVLAVLLLQSTRREAVPVAVTGAVDLDTVPAGHLPPAPADVACRELVSLATDYGDGALPPDWRRALDDHVRDCDGCTRYLQQMKEVIRAIEHLARTMTPPVDDGR
jgi:MFS family permease